MAINLRDEPLVAIDKAALGADARACSASPQLPLIIKPAVAITSGLTVALKNCLLRVELLGQSMKIQCVPDKLAACLIALAMVVGCASTTVSNRQQLVSGPIPRPGQIWVYNFAATPADIPPESAWPV